KAFARHADGVVDGRKMAGFKLDVDHRTNDLDHLTDGFYFLRHGTLLQKLLRRRDYAVEDAPLTISIISFVMAAWRTLFTCNFSASITSPVFFVAASIAVMRAACSAADDSSMARRICVST